MVAIIPDFALCNVVEHPARRAGKFAFFSLEIGAQFKPSKIHLHCPNSIQ